MECFICYSNIVKSECENENYNFVVNTCSFHHAHVECALAWFSSGPKTCSTEFKCPVCHKIMDPKEAIKLEKYNDIIEQLFQQTLKEDSDVPLILKDASSIILKYESWEKYVKEALIAKATKLLEILKMISYSQYYFVQRREMIQYLINRPKQELFMWISNGKFTFVNEYENDWLKILLDYCKKERLQDEYFLLYVEFFSKLDIREKQHYGRWILFNYITKRDNLVLVFDPSQFNTPAVRIEDFELRNFYHIYLIINENPEWRRFIFKRILIPCSIDVGNKQAANIFGYNALGPERYYHTAIFYCVMKKDVEMLKHIFESATKSMLEFSYPKLAKMMADPEIFTTEMEEIVMNNHVFYDRRLFTSILRVTKRLMKIGLLKKPVIDYCELNMSQ